LRLFDLNWLPDAMRSGVNPSSSPTTLICAFLASNSSTT
jgi:hypothetical protein